MAKHLETLAIRTQTDNSAHREHSSAVYLTSSFVFDSAEQAAAMFNNEIPGSIYTRYSNPNNDEFIKKLCLLEGAEDGISCASGMSPMFTSMAGLLSQSDHVLACRSIFGSTHQVLTSVFGRWGIDYTYADINEPDTWESNITEKTKMIFVETPSNPGLDILDLEWLGKLAQQYDLILNVDNCFATPYIQRPIEWGAHIVTHSATKLLDGQGRTIGGAIVGYEKWIEPLRFFARHSGPCLSPFNAWILSKSMETLALRVKEQSKNAFQIAEMLEGHKAIQSVKYPFLPSHPKYAIAQKQMALGGILLTFDLKGGLDAGMAFLNNLKMLSLSANLGDTRTIVTHPASTTHSKLTEEERLKVGILPGLIRISVGLENINDILEDIMNALKPL